MFFFDDIDETIFKLREKGNDYIEISNILKKQGIKLRPFMIEERCKLVYARKNLQEPKDCVKEKEDKAIKKPQLLELIFALREQGNKYKQISEHLLNEKGIKKSITEVRAYYLEYCKKLKIENPKKCADKYPQILGEEVLKLREAGYSYEDIVAYYKEKGIVANSYILRKKCKEECKRAGKKYKIRVKLRKKVRDVIKIPEEEIFALREKNVTYDEIVDYYKEQGIEITKETIRKRCKRIYEQKGIEEPKAKVKLSPERRSKRFQMPAEEVVKLKEEGLSNRQILEYYKQKGINVGIGVVAQRCKEVYDELGLGEVPKNRRREIIIPDEELFELRERRLSYKQIVKYYKEKGITVSATTIENRCKQIYSERGIQNPITKNVVNISDEEIIALREKKLSFRKISEYYKEKGIQVTDKTINNRYVKAVAKRKKSLTELNNTLNNLLIKKQKTDNLLQQLTGALINIKNNKKDIENER